MSQKTIFKNFCQDVEFCYWKLFLKATLLTKIQNGKKREKKKQAVAEVVPSSRQSSV